MPSIGLRSFFGKLRRWRPLREAPIVCAAGIGVSRRDRPLKTEVADAAVHRVPQQARLTDPERSFECAVVAPAIGACWPYVAVCDARARVLLIDQRTRSVARLWKGYRKARCAFVEAMEPMANDVGGGGSGSRRRRALFLVIFAPKRGLLEVWTMQVRRGGGAHAAVSSTNCRTGRESRHLKSIATAVCFRL